MTTSERRRAEVDAARTRRRGRAGRRGRSRSRSRPADDDEDDDGARRPPPDPGAKRRYRFKHPTASGKTVAAAGFVEACRTVGVLILTHRRLLVDQFKRDLKEQGYGPRLRAAIERRTGASPSRRR